MNRSPGTVELPGVRARRLHPRDGCEIIPPAGNRCDPGATRRTHCADRSPRVLPAGSRPAHYWLASPVSPGIRLAAAVRSPLHAQVRQMTPAVRASAPGCRHRLPARKTKARCPAHSASSTRQRERRRTRQQAGPTRQGNAVSPQSPRRRDAVSPEPGRLPLGNGPANRAAGRPGTAGNRAWGLSGCTRGGSESHRARAAIR